MVAGSNPAAATNTKVNLSSLLTQIDQLSQKDRDKLFSLAHPEKTPTLDSPIQGLDDWLADCRLRGLSHGTIRLYSSTVKKFLELYPIPTQRDFRNYLVDRLRVVSEMKVKNDQKSLHSFFNFLEEQGLWLDNPTKGSKLMKTRKVIREAPAREHVGRLLAAWPDSPHRLKYRLLIFLFVDTGLRILEACFIEIKNVNLERLEIKVLGKGNKERVVPISGVTADLMREYLAAYPQVEKGRYLFPANSVEGYQSTHNLERTFRRLCKKLDLPRITPHMLRHYFATYALRNGAKVELISKILGHSSVGITLDVYRTVTQGETRAEHARFGPMAQNNEGLCVQ